MCHVFIFILYNTNKFANLTYEKKRDCRKYIMNNPIFSAEAYSML